VRRFCALCRTWKLYTALISSPWDGYNRTVAAQRRIRSMITGLKWFSSKELRFVKNKLGFFDDTQIE